MIKTVLLTAMGLMVSICCFAQTNKSDWRLVWSDEFNYKGLPDTIKWNYETGNNNGWGNNELQYYTDNKPQNARVENGRLIIEARKEKIDSFNYTSARLVTKRKASWQYGKIEVKAKIPKGVGSWPAIWMLADSIKVWPDDGEIDIMEHVGFHQGYIHGQFIAKNIIKASARKKQIQYLFRIALQHFMFIPWNGIIK